MTTVDRVISPQAKDRAMESALEAIAIADMLGNLTYVNPALLRLWEYSSAGEVLGRPITDFWITPRTAAQMVQTVIDKGLWKGEMTARTRGGKTFDVCVTASIVRDTFGAPLCLVAEFEDLSGRERFEERIRRLSSFPELNPNPILEMGLDGKLVYANIAATDLAISLGLSGPADFLPADARRLLAEAAAQGEDRTCFREKELGERFFGEYLFYSAEFNSLRVYTLDITEQKRAEETNRELSRMLDIAPGPVFIHDEDGILLYVNKSACDLHGYGREEFMRLTLRDIVAPKDAALVEIRIAAMMSNEGAAFEATHVRNDGTGVPLMVHVRPTVWGNKKAFLSVCTDLTERKRVEAQQLLNEARLESLLRISQYRARDTAELLDMALNEAISLTGSAIGYIYNYYEDRHEFVLNSWSSGVMKECTITEKQSVYQLDKTGIWGEAVRQRRPILVNDFVAPDPLKRGYPAGHAPLSRFLTIPVFSGDSVVAVVGVANKQEPYTDADVRQLTLMMGSVWKLVENRQATERIRKNELKFRSLFSSMQEGFALHELVRNDKGDPSDYVILDANPAFETITGITPVEAIGRKASLLYGTGSAPYLDIYARVALTGEPASFETDFDPMQKSFAISVYSPVKGQFATIFSDITARRKAEAVSQNMEKLESLGVLAAGIAHDFNNLLSGVFGYLDLAREECQPDTGARRHLEKALTTFRCAKDLTQQLLTFAKGGDPALTTGTIEPLLREATAFALSGSAVSCSFDIAEDVRPCDFDESQMSQAVHNIVLNAVQAMPHGGSLRVSAANLTVAPGAVPGLAAGSYVSISFSDSGEGIPPAVLPRIFDPFFTTKQGGTGMGLATAFSIVKKHGGLILVESSGTGGATFRIFLPASNGAVAPAGAEAPAHKGHGAILVMDDEENIRLVVADMAALLGYSTVFAPGGAEALQELEKADSAGAPFCAAIFDLTIRGGMGGREAIAKLRRTFPGLPVFVTSGYSEDPVMASPGYYGFTDKIAKPFRKADLAALLEKHLGKTIK